MFQFFRLLVFDAHQKFLRFGEKVGLRGERDGQRERESESKKLSAGISELKLLVRQGKR